MANPVDTKGKKTITLKIFKGPSLHLIMDSFGSPRDDWYKRAIEFEILLPYDDEKSGKRKQMKTCVSYIPSELKHIDLAGNLKIGCLRHRDFARVSMADFSRDAPIQIAEYSTKSRKGEMEVGILMYRELVGMLGQGVCY